MARAEDPQRRSRQEPTDPSSPSASSFGGNAAVDRLAVSDSRLFELYDQMIGNVCIPDVLRDVADTVCRDLHAHRASIYLIDRETHEQNLRQLAEEHLP